MSSEPTATIDRAPATMTLNLGPSHPATHGIVRLVVTVEGEKVLTCDPQIGFLHRGFEKMCESVRWNQVMPYTDRLNYVSPLANNFGWAMAVEKLLGVTPPMRAQQLRVLLAEVSRVIDHSVSIAAQAMELAAFSVFFYMADAREYLFDSLEAVTGARVTNNYGRIGGLAADLPSGWIPDLEKALDKAFHLYDECERLLVENRIFRDRTEGVGVITAEDAVSWGITGPFLRGCGVPLDLRKTNPYWTYANYDFDVPVGRNGDTYDRVLVRFEEMRQSRRIIRQVLETLEDGPVLLDDARFSYAGKPEVYRSIEGTIRQFMLTIDGPRVPAGEVYSYTEAPNGELGFYVVSDGTGMPYRVRCRPPCWYIMQSLAELIPGSYLADIVPIFGSVNMIGGECDR